MDNDNIINDKNNASLSLSTGEVVNDKTTTTVLDKNFESNKFRLANEIFYWALTYGGCNMEAMEDLFTTTYYKFIQCGILGADMLESLFTNNDPYKINANFLKVIHANIHHSTIRLMIGVVKQI